MGGDVINLESEDDFKQAVKESNNRPVFFDFTAGWCKPCQKIKPVFKELAKEQGAKALFCVVDIDELDEVAMDLGVTAIPAIHKYVGSKLESKLQIVSEEKLKAF